MQQSIKARLSEPLPEPELSRMWEVERRTFTGPEILFGVTGNEVTLTFDSRNGGPFEGLKRKFEAAIRRERPACAID